MLFEHLVNLQSCIVWLHKVTLEAISAWNSNCAMVLSGKC